MREPEPASTETVGFAVFRRNNHEMRYLRASVARPPLPPAAPLDTLRV